MRHSLVKVNGIQCTFPVEGHTAPTCVLPVSRTSVQIVAERHAVGVIPILVPASDV
jgi:hypothetical protein